MLSTAGEVMRVHMWVRAGKEDVAQILDDLGSLSDPMRLGQPGAQPTCPSQHGQIWRCKP